MSWIKKVGEGSCEHEISPFNHCEKNAALFCVECNTYTCEDHKDKHSECGKPKKKRTKCQFVGGCENEVTNEHDFDCDEDHCDEHACGIFEMRAALPETTKIKKVLGSVKKSKKQPAATTARHEMLCMEKSIKKKKPAACIEQSPGSFQESIPLSKTTCEVKGCSNDAIAHCAACNDSHCVVHDQAGCFELFPLPTLKKIKKVKKGKKVPKHPMADPKKPAVKRKQPEEDDPDDDLEKLLDAKPAATAAAASSQQHTVWGAIEALEERVEQLTDQTKDNCAAPCGCPKGSIVPCDDCEECYCKEHEKNHYCFTPKISPMLTKIKKVKKGKKFPKQPMVEPKKPAVKRKQPEEDDPDDDLEKLLDAVAPVAKKAMIKPANWREVFASPPDLEESRLSPAERAKRLRDQAAQASAQAEKIEAEIKAAERKARLTPPFELFHGAVFSGQGSDAFANGGGTVDEPDEWIDVQFVTVDSDKWKWCPLTIDGPLYVCHTHRGSGMFAVYRNIKRISNDPKPIPVQEDPLTVDD